jgi:tetratricopeptide (TPR) repeat protein
MRRGIFLWVAVVLGVVLWPAAAGAATMHRWAWQVAPDDEKLRAAIAVMKDAAEKDPDLFEVKATQTSIVLFAKNGERDGYFIFPGRRDGVNSVLATSAEYDDLVTRCLSAARVYFTPDELATWSEAPSQRGRYPGSRYSPFGVGFWGLLYPIAILFLLYLLFNRSRGGTSWGSYYLFWFIVPMAISFLSEHPLVLLLIPVALVARRWLPDPYLYFKHSGRMRSLEAQVAANPENLTVRRDLAVIWLERRRPARALPLLDEALARDPESSELHFLRGVALLNSKRWEEAVEPLIQACRLDTRLRYGEPYLRAADALMALRRWEDADEALGHFLKVSRSSVEGWYKMALVRRGRGDEKGAKEAFKEAKAAYRDSPAFHRRRHLGWYLRALVRS